MLLWVNCIVFAVVSASYDFGADVFVVSGGLLVCLFL